MYSRLRDLRKKAPAQRKIYPLSQILSIAPTTHCWESYSGIEDYQLKSSIAPSVQRRRVQRHPLQPVAMPRRGYG